MAASSSRGIRLWLLLGVAVLVLVGGGAAIAWRLLNTKPVPDMTAVLHTNNRGIGYMERYKFPEAVKEFEEVVRLAPDWEPGRINLGIAILNLALGVPTDEKSAANDRALLLFQEILKKDPDNPYAHFCRGLIIYWNGNPEEYDHARAEFTAVTRHDDKDPFAWFWLGKTSEEVPAQAIPCFQRALELDPYFNAARFNLHSLLQQTGQADKARAVMDQWQALNGAEWITPLDEKIYSERGRYARVIAAPEEPALTEVGPLPMFRRDDKLQVQLAPGARWAATADFGTDVVAELRARVRKRFGGVMVVLDYNRDGKPDLLLLGAVVEKGQVRDLLLRNDGSSHFTDVTAEAGLGGARPSLGCCVADFDNDGHPDLLLTGAGRVWLFRNNQKGGFEDVTAKAGLDKLQTVCLGAAFVDLDQDGDLDLIVAQYADTPEHALAALEGKETPGAPGMAVYLNTGEAVAASKSEDPLPLKPSFKRAEGPVELLGEKAPVVNLAVTDLDLDADLDLFVLADGKAPSLVLNDRLLRFHRASLPETVAPAGRWNGALVLDVRHQERSDLLLLGPDRSPLLLIHGANASDPNTTRWFEAQSTNAPPLLQAQAIDLDLDSWTDVVGLSQERKPVLLHNDGRRLTHVPEALGSDRDWPADLAAVAVADMDCDGLPDVLVWSESAGLQAHLNQGNGNHGLKVEVTGHRRVDPGGGSNRCNADAFGTRVTALAASLRSDVEYTTLSAGLGQSHQPLFLGLGRHSEADLVRLRWPDSTLQAEFNASAGPGCEVQHIDQTNRKDVSCPILFAWNGQRFGFVTDFLGAGSMGESLAGGGHRPPRPEESVKIEAGQLVPRDGQFILKLAEPMDEVTYLDHLQLVVLDHLAGVRVYPDERFDAGGPPPTQELLAFRREIYPIRAQDHHGRDVTDVLRHWDRATVDDFGRRAWIGFAEEHWVELDFGDRLKEFGPKDRLVLCLAGWTDYPYPESIWAANQAGVAMLPPLLERRSADGRWEKIADAGFPAGLPRMMTLDVTGLLTGPTCTVRLRTNMHVFWDQIYVAPLIQKDAVQTTPLEVTAATLSARGCMQEHSPDGRQPTVYDYDRLDAVPVSRLAGRLTRLGDVTELLRQTDDRFVLFGPGDELDVRFDAKGLPEPRPGWTRSYVLRTWGYCKDCAPFTDSGATVEPLPFRGMRDYPYGKDQKYPHPDYQQRWNTRPVGRLHQLLRH